MLSNIEFIIKFKHLSSIFKMFICYLGTIAILGPSMYGNGKVRSTYNHKQKLIPHYIVSKYPRFWFLRLYNTQNIHFFYLSMLYIYIYIYTNINSNMHLTFISIYTHTYNNTYINQHLYTKMHTHPKLK